MSFETHNNYKYDPELFEAIATFERYRQRYNEAEGYAKFMIGRRASGYQRNAVDQQQRVHYVVKASETESYCVCSLVFQGGFAGGEAEENKRTDGHWCHVTGQLAQVYIWFRNLVCAGCDWTEPAEYDENDDPVVDRKTLEDAHANCGLTR